MAQCKDAKDICGEEWFSDCWMPANPFGENLFAKLVWGFLGLLVIRGKCVKCAPDCDGKECGGDGCGGSCGECRSSALFCIDSKCVGYCVSDCAGKECGPDGCGGSCGLCPEGGYCTAGGQCKKCFPACDDKECGDDGCGGSCGTCPDSAKYCVEGECVANCTPTCEGKECGNDNCGGSCGDCPPDAPYCSQAKCYSECILDCEGKECGSDGCGSSCGECSLPQHLCIGGQCVCQPDCEDKECGNDGCGGSCGECLEHASCNESTGECVCASECSPPGDSKCVGNQVWVCTQFANYPPCNKWAFSEPCIGSDICEDGKCVKPPCGPGNCDGCCMDNETCLSANYPTHCGKGGIPCQDCTITGGVCIDGECCQPDCIGKECGNDGCDGTCGECEEGLVCSDGVCCQPDCDDKQCGDDGCGGDCGKCKNNVEECQDGQCVALPDVICTLKKAECGLVLFNGTNGMTFFECGECPDGWYCYMNKCFCDSDCFGKQCGYDDGCGGVCQGWCPGSQEVCQDGVCECQADCFGKDCGPDGCGDTCGSCPQGYYCVDGQCACMPQCAGKDCGDDGCGGNCGDCEYDEWCHEGECIPLCLKAKENPNDEWETLNLEGWSDVELAWRALEALKHCFGTCTYKNYPKDIVKLSISANGAVGDLCNEFGVSLTVWYTTKTDPVWQYGQMNLDGDCCRCANAYHQLASKIPKHFGYNFDLANAFLAELREATENPLYFVLEEVL